MDIGQKGGVFSLGLSPPPHPHPRDRGRSEDHLRPTTRHRTPSRAPRFHCRRTAACASPASCDSVGRRSSTAAAGEATSVLDIDVTSLHFSLHFSLLFSLFHALPPLHPSISHPFTTLLGSYHAQLACCKSSVTASNPSCTRYKPFSLVAVSSKRVAVQMVAQTAPRGVPRSPRVLHAASLSSPPRRERVLVQPG
eukprot:scaffold72754_cov67-Phaeocystis_antarctica.AAC.5